VHADAEVQETPNRPLNWAPGWLGAGWMRHVVPFHRSISGPALEPPTATQRTVELHISPLRKLNCAPAGSGDG
jgi:hypothetical protein